MLLQDVQASTQKSRLIISKKMLRTARFDKYVLALDNFGLIMNGTIKLTKNVIILVYRVLMYKDGQTMSLFLQGVNDMLMFLHKNSVFVKLNEVKIILYECYHVDSRLIERITKIHNIMFNIFNMALSITTFFIPQLAIVSSAVNGLDMIISTHLDRISREIEEKNIDIDKIVRNLLDINIRSEILAEVDFYHVIQSLQESDVNAIMAKIDVLQNDYVEIQASLIALKVEIDRYRQKKSHILPLVGICI